MAADASRPCKMGHKTHGMGGKQAGGHGGKHGGHDDGHKGGHGKHERFKKLMARMDVLDARMAKIEVMLERLLQR